MDKSEVQKIVTDNLSYLQKICAVRDWDIVVEVVVIEDGDMGTCWPDARYHKAKIHINHEQMESERDVLETLRHELFHCTLGGLNLFDNIASALIGEEDEKVNDAYERARQFASEQMVLRLEGMHTILCVPLKDPYKDE